MVRVPVSNGPRESLNPLSGVRVESSYIPTRNPLTALRAPAEQMDDTFARADSLRVEDTINKVRVAQSALHDEATAQLGANVLPKDGKTFTDDYMGKFGEVTAKAESELSSDRQKVLYQRRMGQISASFQAQVNAHERAQLKAHADDVDQSTVLVEAQNAGKVWGNDAELAIGQTRVNAAVEASATRNGWDTGTKTLKLQESLTKFHGEVLGNAIEAGNLQYAKTYLAKHGEEMTPKARDGVEAMIQKRQGDLAVDSLVDGIFQSLGPKNDKDPVSLDKMYAAIPEDTPPEAKKAIKQGLVDMAHAHDYSVKERTNATESEFYQAIEKGANWSQIKQSPSFGNLDGKTQASLRKHFEDERGITKGDGTPVNASSEYWKLVENPDKLMRMSVDEITAMTPSLGKSYRERLQEERRKLLKPGEIGKVSIDKDILKSEYRAAMNIKPGVKLTTEDETMLGDLDVAVTIEQEASGVKWSTENTQKLVRQRLKPIVTKQGGFFGGKETLPAFKAVRQVPTAYADLVRRKAPNATTEQIAQAYFIDKYKGLVD